MVRFEWAQVVAFDDAAKPADHDRRYARHAARQIAARFAALSLPARIELRGGRVPPRGEKARSALSCADEASNTFEAMPQTTRTESATPLPKRERVHLAVHRYDNMLYYKRLEPEAFAILQGLQKGQDGRKSLRCRARESEANGASIGSGKSRNGFTTGPRSAGSAGQKNENADRKNSTAGVIALGSALRSPSASRHPAFIGDGNFFSPAKGS